MKNIIGELKVGIGGTKLNDSTPYNNLIKVQIRMASMGRPN